MSNTLIQNFIGYTLMHDMTLVIGKTRHQLMRTRAFFVYHVNCFNVFRKMGYMPPIPMLSGKQKPKSSMVSLYDWIVNYRSLYLQNKWYMFIGVQSSAIANFTFIINCTCSYGFNRRLFYNQHEFYTFIEAGWQSLAETCGNPEPTPVERMNSLSPTAPNSCLSNIFFFSLDAQLHILIRWFSGARKCFWRYLTTKSDITIHFVYQMYFCFLHLTTNSTTVFQIYTV